MGSSFPRYPERTVQILDGFWEFAFQEACPDPAAPDFTALNWTEVMSVPGVFDTLVPDCGRRGTGFYRLRGIQVKTKKLALKLGGLGLWGAVFWDRKLIGTDDLPYSGMGFDFDAGKADANGGHELVIAIDNRFDFKRTPLFSQYYDFYGHGGLYRSVELHELPDVSIDRAQVETLSLSGLVRIHLSLNNVREGARIKIRYAFDDGTAHDKTCTVSDAGYLEWDSAVPDASLWSPEKPNLHTIRVEIPNGDSIVERFGIRTVCTKDQRILVNGKEVRLLGCCRHETHPQFGPALPEQIILEDLRALRELGCNFVRGAHYPQDQRFLEQCDENGILVWEESIAWNDRMDHIGDPRFRDAQLRQLPLMIKNSFNHPCVIIYGILNEGDSGSAEARTLYSEMLQTLRDMDSTRLITYASSYAEQDINFDLADLISLNTYPGWYAEDREQVRPLNEIAPRLEKFLAFVDGNPKLKNKPFLISEIGAGAIYGFRDRFRAHWSEEYQADYLEEVCRFVQTHARVAGLAIWQFCDGRTFDTSMALTRPRGFNNKGLLDEYRRPKLAFDLVKKYFHELEEN